MKTRERLQHIERRSPPCAVAVTCWHVPPDAPDVVENTVTGEQLTMAAFDRLPGLPVTLTLDRLLAEEDA